VHHAAPVVFPVDFEGGEHVYRVHPMNVQLMTDPVIMRPRRTTIACTSPTVLDAEVLWSGLEFVMMVALSSKLFKEH
jgi:hypothetical protein